MKNLITLKNRSIIVFSLFFSSIILCFMAFYNGYPLVYPDTGTYISSGFRGFVPDDRPLTYGLFIRHMSLSESLWLVILMQALIVSLLVFYYFYYLSKHSIKIKIFAFISYISLITFFFGASVTVSDLIPDIFTPITILSLGLFLFVDTLKLRDKIILSIILIFSISVHNSHFLIVAFSILCMYIFFFYERIRKKQVFFYRKLKRLVLITILSISSIFFTMGINYIYSGKVSYLGGGHVFLLGRINDMGLLQDYLNNKCQTKNYKICAYKDKIPWDMLWDPSSPLYLTGGWVKNKEEYTTIIFDILTTPKYLKLFIIRTLESSVKQFFSFDTGDTPVQTTGSAPFGPINQFFKETTKEYLGSLQNTNKLGNFETINRSQQLIIMFLLIVFFMIFISNINIKWKIFIAFFLITLYLNSTVVTISSLVPRYQSRVIWLLPIPLFIIFLNYFNVSYFKEKIMKFISKSNNSDII